MKAWETLARLIWLSTLFMLSLQCMGCVSFQYSAPNCSPTVSNCGIPNNCCDPGNSVECCDLNDRPELISRLRPISDWTSERKQRTSMWFASQRERCGAMRGSVRGWVSEKKAEANAPPWPRFHPVPTKPVFEPEQAEEDMSPEVYGRFGKG